MTDELDKTIPPQRAGDNDYLRQMEMREAITEKGYRERKADGHFLVGDLIMGRYKVLAELGQGGMGVVYKCFDETAGIEVALKALPPELSHNSQEMEDIKENFQLVHNLHHPNIASSNTLEKNPENGNYYLIMECCEGEDLRRWIKRKRRDNPLTLNDVLPVIRQVADALDYAHAQKIIHRDIKPGNIMIDGVGNVKVLDFGLAAQIHTSMTRVSMAYHGTSGTGPYMAPEQWRGRAQGAAADQYALAVMAYEMLAGRLPFESTDPAVLKQAVLDEIPDGIPDLPSAAQNALKRAMSKDPADRFNSCADFAAALGGAKVGRAKKVSSGKSGGGAWKWIAAVIVLALIAAGAFFALNRNTAAEARKAEEARLALERQEQERLERERIIKLAEKGKALYDKGQYAEAVKLLSEAAEKGNALAQNTLGVCYERGQGVEKDFVKAVEWYRKAAEQGYADAQNNLGVCYKNGRGVEKDYYEAVKWYRKAAEQGNADAQNNLGVCYHNGQGVEKDYYEAVKWYRKAAEQGNMYAQFHLGACYKNGQGVEKDLDKALELYRKSAEQGDVIAKINLIELEEKIKQARILKEEPKKTITIADGVSLTMIGVEPGSFMMGSENGDDDEKPVHRVRLTKPYYLGETEVTQAQWRAVMGNNPSRFQEDSRPVECVSWDDAMAFCQKLNDQGRAPKGWKFTLPTEAQWEFAARGGNKSRGYTYSGSNNIGEVAWYYGNSGRERLDDSVWSLDKLQSNACQTHAVPQKGANELGFYDMSGNMWEWCLDWYGSYSSSAVTDPQGPQGPVSSFSGRVLRGGGWSNSAQDCRSANRNDNRPDHGDDYGGFRLALVPVQ